ncbi:phage baseplate upper protein [Bacillus cereus]|uniref:phage baseplate upper protein n=1 Tax=Bacillus cereus TaxID=1396 RepID=UPI00396D0CC2
METRYTEHSHFNNWGSTREKEIIRQLLRDTNSVGNINEKFDVLKQQGRNLVRNTDFVKMPYIQSRSKIYTFEATKDSFIPDKKSLFIQSEGYESSTDPNKDFAFLLTETMLQYEQLKVSFWVYPSESNKEMNIRMAYSQGDVVYLGDHDQWNKVSILLDLSAIAKQNNYLYFNMLSSYSIYMTGLEVERYVEETKTYPTSFKQVNDVLTENSSTIQNTKGSIERMIEVAQTYVEKVNTLSYGNIATPYDAKVDPINGKYQIDCSSFANLLIHGIPYDQSRYVKNENVNSKLFFQNLDGYKYRFANEIARYAFEKGYSYKPNSDFSNVEPGDVLFFSWTNREMGGDLAKELRENAFMKIDHVAVFLNKKNESYWSTLQFDNGISSVYYDATNEYMSQCVIAARFPFSSVDSQVQSSNLLYEGDVVRNVSNTTQVYTYTLAEPLKKGKYYSFVFDGNVLTDDCYFVLQVNNKTIYTDYGKKGKYNGITTFYFPYLLDDIADKIAVGIGRSGSTDLNRSAVMNWCMLFEGYERDKTSYVKPAKSFIRNFNLIPSLEADLLTSYAPYYKYAIEGEKMYFNFSLPFNTLRKCFVIVASSHLLIVLC